MSGRENSTTVSSFVAERTYLGLKCVLLGLLVQLDSFLHQGDPFRIGLELEALDQGQVGIVHPTVIHVVEIRQQLCVRLCDLLFAVGFQKANGERFLDDNSHELLRVQLAFQVQKNVVDYH
jgi:hypothetical protein